MKKSTKNVEFLFINKVLAGISLGTSTAPEHAEGIAEIKSAFGVLPAPTERISGAWAHAVRKCVSSCKVLQDTQRGFTYLIFLPERCTEIVEPHDLDTLMEISEHDQEEPIIAAWSSSEFSIRVRTQEFGTTLIDIFDDFKGKDILILLNEGSDLFAQQGLLLIKKSALEKEVPFKRHLEMLVKIDCDRLYLERQAKKAGVEQRLLEAEIGLYKLTPTLLTQELRTQYENRGRHTQYPILFWLKAWSHYRIPEGLYTVEEIDQFIQNFQARSLRKSA